MSTILTSSHAQAAANSGSQGLQVAFYIMMGIGVVVAIAMSVLIFFTGKGDAMGGGSSSIRTSFKGKTSFDDQIYSVTLYMGIGFMAIMLICDVLLQQINK
jgi:preprotein translocase subunit SecG